MQFHALSPFSRSQIRSARGPKEIVDAWKPIAVWDELEVESPSNAAESRVFLLTGSECRFTCTMCDLWRHTLDTRTPPGSIPQQIQFGLAQPPSNPSVPSGITSANQRWVKLYNSSNFFDDHNVPIEDRQSIAELLQNKHKVVVENHPKLVKDDVKEFANSLSGKLEVAMGLETIHPELLTWLNKQFTVDDFIQANDRLREWDVDTRVFLLLGLPGLTPQESIHWCLESLRLCDRIGIRHCSIIPLRSNHGILSQLRDNSRIPAITSTMLEDIHAEALSSFSTLVTVDLWDWNQLPGHCPECCDMRRFRLENMNLTQCHIPLSSTVCKCVAAIRQS